eukprot:COSAG02_NODE_39391_length_417_cov_1.723270_1_plen_139_part_11
MTMRQRPRMHSRYETSVLSRRGEAIPVSLNLERLRYGGQLQSNSSGNVLRWRMTIVTSTSIIGAPRDSARSGAILSQFWLLVQIRIGFAGSVLHARMFVPNRTANCEFDRARTRVVTLQELRTCTVRAEEALKSDIVTS